MRFWKHLSKRGLALFLALTMCLGLVQLTASAEETGDSPAATLHSVYQLVCQTQEHVHGEMCYSLHASALPEGAENHVCTRSCYSQICTAGEHVHTKACYDLLDEYPEEMLQAAERVGVYACGQEGHTHNFLCGVPVTAAAEEEQPPVEEEQPPVEEEQPPVEEVPPPVEEEQPPVEEVPPPVEEEQPPVEEEQLDSPAENTPGTVELPEENVPLTLQPVYSGEHCAVTAENPGTHVHDETCGTEVIWVADPEDMVQPADNIAAKIGEVEYETLADAVTHANAGDIITLTKDVAESLTVAKSVTIDLGGHTWSANGSTTLTTNKADVTLQNGTITSVGGSTRSNAIKANSGSLTLENVTVKDHNGTNAALDIMSSVTALTIKGGKLSNNNSTGILFGISSTTFHMTGTEIVENSASSLLYCSSGTITIEDVEAYQNTASGSDGGGVMNIQPVAPGIVTLRSVMAYENKALKGFGGAFRFGNSNGVMNITLDRCELYSNEAEKGGGAIAVVGSRAGNHQVTIKDTLIYKNTANNGSRCVGGGLYVGSTKPETVITLSGDTHIYGNETPNEAGHYSADIGLSSAYVTATYSGSAWAPKFDKYTDKRATLHIDDAVLLPYTAADGSVYTLKDNSGNKAMQYNGGTSSTKKKQWYWPIGYSSTATEPASVYYGGTHSGDNAIVANTLEEAVAEAQSGSKVVYVCETVALTEDAAGLLNESGVTFARCETYPNDALFEVSGTVTLDGAKIDGRMVESTSPLIYGSNGANLTITGDTEIKNGNSSGDGGGIHIEYGSLTMTGGTITGNRGASGGGIYSKSTNLVFEGGTVSGNSAQNSGGGAYIYSGSSRFGMNGGRTLFKKNTAEAYGGAIFVTNNEEHYIEQANFIDNTANGSYYNGGAIYVNKATTVYMKNVYVSDSAGESAVGVCPTGNLAVYELEGLLSVNSKSKADIRVIPGGVQSEVPPVTYLPKYVIGGGEVTYTNLYDKSTLTDPFVEGYFGVNTNVGDPQTLSNAKKVAEEEGVVITGNSSSVHGGGIMTNGLLKIGKETTSLRVEKVWSDDAETHDNDQILVWLTQNGEIVPEGFRPSDGYVVLNKDNNWSYTWTGLADGIDWGVKEAAVGGYTSEVKVKKDTKFSKIADKYYIATITNTPGGPNNILAIHKTALGNTDPDESYWFTLTLDKVPEDAAYALKIDEELIPIYRNTDGKPEVTFSLKHDQIATVEGLPENFAYTLTEAPGNYTTTMYESVTANEGGAGSIYSVEVVNACFEPTTVEIPIQKTLEGREVQKGDYFRFEILKCDADESPVGGAAELPYDIICLHMGAAADEDLEGAIAADEKDTVTVNGVQKRILHVPGDKASFLLGGTAGGDSETASGFKLPGEYRYTIHELPNDQLPGVSIDPTRYHVLIDVQPDETGALKADICGIWTWDGVNKMGWNKDQKLSVPLQFKNIFKTQEVTRIFETQKTLINGHLQPGQFSFLLEEQGVLPWSEDYAGSTKPETAEALAKLTGWTDRGTPDVKAANGDSGLVQFAGITYTLADAGESPDTGLVYAYTIREEIPDGAVQNADGNWVYNNIVYSGDVKQVFVHVFTTAESIEGEKVQVVNANVYSTDSENGEGREDGDIYYISGFTNTVMTKTHSLTVVKVWSGDTETDRPASVTVQLLRNGAVYDTAELSAANGWTHTWEELEEDAEWTVAEIDVPEGYTSSSIVSGDGLVVTITNTRTPDNPPDNPSTPGDDDDDDDDDGDRTDDTPPPPAEEEPPVPVLPELPDPNEPDSPDVVTIVEDDVPTTYVKVQDPETEEFIYIPEDEIPLYGFEIPETGDSGRTTLWAFLSTASLIGVVGLHLTSRKRRKDEE